MGLFRSSMYTIDRDDTVAGHEATPKNSAACEASSVVVNLALVQASSNLLMRTEKAARNKRSAMLVPASHGTRMGANDPIEVPTGHPGISGKGLQNLSKMLATICSNKSCSVLNAGDEIKDLSIGEPKLAKAFDKRKVRLVTHGEGKCPGHCGKGSGYINIQLYKGITLCNCNVDECPRQNVSRGSGSRVASTAILPRGRGGVEKRRRSGPEIGQHRFGIGIAHSDLPVPSSLGGGTTRFKEITEHATRPLDRRGDGIKGTW